MIGLGISIPKIAVNSKGGSLVSLISSLFRNNEPGVWYDPSDIKLDWRYNLLTYTEQFDNAAWGKNGSTISANTNATLDPLGGNTADKIQETATSGAHLVQQGVSSIVGATYKASVWLKAAERSIAVINVYDNADRATWFNLQNGTVLTNSAGNTATIEPAGDGWYLCTVSRVTASTTTFHVVHATIANNTLTYAGTAGSGIYIWGASLTTAANADRPYQKITDGVQDYFTYQPQPVLYQDAAGTTPVTAVEQPVGLMLDKSKGLTLGPELVTNGDFSNGTTGWNSSTIYTSTSSVVDGVFRVNSTTNYGLQLQPISCVVGRAYVITGQARRGTVLSAAIGASANANGSAAIALATTTSADFVALRCQFVATSTIMYVVLGGSAGNPSGYHEYDNISVREIPGNHATQTTSTSRPVLSARYNLLTKTEQFDDGAWTKINATVTANAVNAPEGTLTADTITATSTRPIIAATISSLPATQYKYSVSVKKGLSFTLSFDNGFTAGIGATFNGVTGAYVTSNVLGSGYILNSYSCITHPNNSDYWLASINVTPPSASNTSLGVWINRNELSGYPSSGLANIGDTLTIWGASLVPANQASIPYQRVNTATDYDADPSKFKPYLRFDGIDDWLVTPTITPGTDKAQVFAGVRKLSDAAAGVIVELAAAQSITGAMGLVAREYAAGDYSLDLRGMSQYSWQNYVPFNAPITNVLSGLLDQAAPTLAGEIRLRANGELATTGSSFGGPGGNTNFASAPLYIGRRGGTTLPFNGHLYGLIVRFGANLPIDTIEKTEKFIANKTGFTAPVINGLPTIEVTL